MPGRPFSSPGDFNGDGFADILVGAPGADPGGSTNGGSVYVLFGKPSGFGDIDLANFSPADGFRIDGRTQSAYFFDVGSLTGFSVPSAGAIAGHAHSHPIAPTPPA